MLTLTSVVSLLKKNSYFLIWAGDTGRGVPLSFPYLKMVQETKVAWKAFESPHPAVRFLADFLSGGGCSSGKVQEMVKSD